MINKVVIPAAGMGTRLLPTTKEMAKEMLPIFAFNKDSGICVKPLLQVVFEQFYDFAVREFCFIVGRGKESISNHFTTDVNFVNVLNGDGKHELAEELSNFYGKVQSSSIVFISQSEPRGFGDAVLKAEPYVKEPFLVQAGDTLILSRENNHLKRLLDVYNRFKVAATLFVKEVEDPRPFGVIEGKEVEQGIYNVKSVVEKPDVPRSNLAITALYLFTPEIFQALRSTSLGKSGELQLTDGIQKLIDAGLDVMALKLGQDELWLDIGSPQSYWTALQCSKDFVGNERNGKRQIVI